MNFKLHDIQWDKEKIQAFWNSLGTNASMESLYFSKQRGWSVLKFARKHIPVEGHVVDLGCGPGYLIEHLLNAGIACEGADLSPDSIDLLSRRFSGNPLFSGAKVCASATEIPFQTESVDVLFYLETIEHLLDADCDESLQNINSVLAKGGHIVATTPFAENLDRAKVVCKSCGCRFHRVQHVRSFDAESLSGLFKAHGFATVFCKPTFLAPRWGVYLKSLHAAGKRTKLACPECGECVISGDGFWRNLSSKFQVNKVLHLVYIGKKI